MERKKLGEAAKTYDSPNGKCSRAIRPKKRGLLLIYPLDPTVKNLFPENDPRRNGPPIIGFAISFPGSNSQEDLKDAVEYMVNRVYLKEEMEGYEQDEELNNDDR